MGDVMIREARPGELAAVGDVRVAAYEAGGFLNPEYAPELRALGAAGDGTVLVAVPDTAHRAEVLAAARPAAPRPAAPRQAARRRGSAGSTPAGSTPAGSAPAAAPAGSPRPAAPQAPAARGRLSSPGRSCW